MIAALSAYNETLGIAAESYAGPMAKKMGSASLRVVTAQTAADSAEKAEGGLAADAASVNLSASTDVFSAVDSFFNLGKSNRFDDFHKLSPEDKEQFIMIVAELAKSHYMGYEEYVINNKVERHDVETQISDERLHNARAYNSSDDLEGLIPELEIVNSDGNHIILDAY
jgi:hypothetical protein